MMVKKNRPQRVYWKLVEDMEKKIDERLKFGLMNRKDAKLPKMTELLTKTQGYKMSLVELGIKKERRKNGK